MRKINPVPKPVKPVKKKRKNGIPKITKKEAKKKLNLLQKEAKGICSNITRLRYGGNCAMCGATGSQAHHFFGWKACSAVRFDLDNLVWLCLGCHIMKVHKMGLTEMARESIIRRIGEIRFNSLRTRAFEVHTWTIEEMEELKTQLTKIEIDEIVKLGALYRPGYRGIVERLELNQIAAELETE